MWDDLFSFVGDFGSAIADTITDLIGPVAEAFAEVPTTIQDFVTSVADAPAVTALAESAPSELAGTAQEMASEAASQASNYVPNATEAALNDGVDFAGTVKGGPVTLDEMFPATQSAQGGMGDFINTAAKGAGAAQSPGIIGSAMQWLEKNPNLAKIAGEAVKGGFSPDPIRLAREKARAEVEARIQLAQWLKDNNRAGGVGVKLNIAPGAGAPVQRLTGEQVYGQNGLIAQGGLIRPYMRG